MANNTMPCVSDLGHTYSYKLQPAADIETGATEAAAKRAALTKVPDGTNGCAKSAVGGLRSEISDDGHLLSAAQCANGERS